MSPLTTHQNSTQLDTVWPSKQFIYQNCSVRKWQQTEPTRYLSNPMFHSTNPQTNLRHWRVLSKEWDHQVWGQSNFVWVTNRRLEDNRFSATKSGHISRSSFITAVAFSLRMEARVFLTCLLGNNLNRSFRHQLDDAQTLDLIAHLEKK